jgi:hypothetical protein
MIEFKDSPFQRYLAGEDALRESPADAYARHAEICSAFLGSLPGDKAGHRYAEGKWSVREVVGHMADADLVFLYRLVSIARGETKPLPGFDENGYAALAGHDSLPWRAVLASWRGVSQAASALIAAIDPRGWERLGAANGVSLTPRDILRVLIGHERHHLRVLRERYGLA